MVDSVIRVNEWTYVVIPKIIAVLDRDGGACIVVGHGHEYSEFDKIHISAEKIPEIVLAIENFYDQKNKP